MVYKQQYWNDYDEAKTETQNIENGAVVTSERMNHIENGVATNNEHAEDLQRQIDSTQSGLIGEFNSEKELKSKYPKGTKGYAIVWFTESNQKVGYTHTYKNGSWVKGNVWNGVGIPNESITPSKTTFLKVSSNLNLFDGEYENIYMTGSTADGHFMIRKGSVYRSAVIKVNEGDKIYIKMAEAGLLKVATVTTTEPVIDSATDGSVLYNNGNNDYYEADINSNDKLLIVSVSNQSEEPYLEITKNIEYDEKKPILSYPKGVYAKDIKELVIEKRIADALNLFKANDKLLWFPQNNTQESYFQFDPNKKSIFINKSLVYGKFTPWIDFRKNYRILFSAEELLIPNDTYVTLVLNVSKLLESDFTNNEIKPSDVLEFVTTHKSDNLKQAKEVFGNNYIILGYYENVANRFIPVNMPKEADYSKKMIIQPRHDRIFIFIPTISGKHLRVRFERTEKTADNNKIWNLSEVHSGVYRQGTFEKEHWLVRPGEWEMALKLKDRPDFIGGSAHGDEIAESMTMLIDGDIFDVEKSDGTQFIEFNEFKFMQRIKCYDPLDNVTQVAYHNVEHTINALGIRINQRVEWLNEYTLMKSYMAMLPILRHDSTNSNYQITDTAIDNLRYKKFDVKDRGFTSEIKDFTNGITNLKVLGRESGISAEVDIKYEPNLDSSFAFVQNSVSSNEPDFNKIYFGFCGDDHEVKAGDIWITESIFKLQLSALR